MAEPRLSVPVFVAGSHVRLTAAHVDALFEDPLTPLWNGASVGAPGTLCLETIKVKAGGQILELRIVQAESTEVCLSPERLREFPEEETIHLDGPRGTVVLATPPRAAARLLALTADDARTLGDPATLSVHVAADRARVFSDLPVVIRGQSALWVDAEDLGSLELTPDARALVL